MKAVIVEKHLFLKVALNEDGEFIKTFQAGNVGDTIEINENGFVMNPLLKRGLVYGFVLFLLVGTVGVGYINAEEYSYVSIDVNPSIEYALNRFDKVVSIKTYKEEDQEILETLIDKKVKGKDISEVLLITEETLKEYGYLVEDDYMLINITSDDTSNKEKLEGKINNTIEEKDNLIISKSDKQERKQAEEYGMSTGKFHEMKQRFDGEVPEEEFIEEFNEMDIKQIIEDEKNKPENPEAPKDDNKPEDRPEMDQNRPEMPEGNNEPAGGPQNGNEQPEINEHPQESGMPEEMNNSETAPINDN